MIPLVRLPFNINLTLCSRPISHLEQICGRAEYKILIHLGEVSNRVGPHVGVPFVVIYLAVPLSGGVDS